MPVRIEITGLKEFRKALRDADRQLPRELRKVFNTAGQAVAREATPRIPEKSGKLARSVRARSTQTEGRVVMGSPTRVPYAGWIEFGGNRKGRGGGIARRPVVRNGRYLYPAYLRRQAEVYRALDEGLTTLAKVIET